MHRFHCWGSVSSCFCLRDSCSQDFPRAYAKEKLKVPQCKTWASAGWKSAWFGSGRCQSCCSQWSQQFALNLLLLPPVCGQVSVSQHKWIRMSVCFPGRNFKKRRTDLQWKDIHVSWQEPSSPLRFWEVVFSVQEGSSCPPGSQGYRNNSRLLPSLN